jgi:hypothetical protein
MTWNKDTLADCGNICKKYNYMWILRVCRGLKRHPEAVEGYLNCEIVTASVVSAAIRHMPIWNFSFQFEWL